jgi:hypothetical protein
MMYNKAQVEAVGDAILATIDAVKDGLGPEDVVAAVGLLTSFSAAADEFKGDADAAILHLVGHMASKIGDTRMDAEVLDV